MDARQHFICNVVCMSFGQLVQQYLVIVDASREVSDDYAAVAYYRAQLECVESIARLRFGPEYDTVLASAAE